MQKIYLSRAQTRAMALDHPIGDPTGGAAYGERNDPISATIAIAGMSYAAPLMMAGNIMAGVAFAGSALSLVGNVTGNKTLSKLGMVAGVVGGVGMMGGFGEAASKATFSSTFGDAAAAGGAGAGSSITAPLSGSPAPVVEGVQAANTSAAANMGSATAAPLDAGGATQNLNVAGGGANTLNAGPAGDLYALGGNSLPTGSPPLEFQLGSAPNAADGLRAGASSSRGLQAGANAGDALYKVGAPDPSFFSELGKGNYMNAAKAAGSNIMDLTKNNPGAALMLGNAVSATADQLSGKTDAEIAALEASTGFADARAQQIQEEIAREKRRRQQVNANLTGVSTGITANPTVQIPQPFQQPAGLINGARAPA